MTSRSRSATVESTILWIDEPQVVTLRSDDGKRFLAVAIPDEQSDADLTFIATVVSEDCKLEEGTFAESLRRNSHEGDRVMEETGQRVRELVWVKHPMIDAWRVDTIVGTYKVVSAKTVIWELRGHRVYVEGKAKTPEEAMASAQADFDRRVLSVLEDWDSDRVLDSERISNARDRESWSLASLSLVLRGLRRRRSSELPVQQCFPLPGRSGMRAVRRSWCRLGIRQQANACHRGSCLARRC